MREWPLGNMATICGHWGHGPLTAINTPLCMMNGHDSTDSNLTNT